MIPARRLSIQSQPSNSLRCLNFEQCFDISVCFFAKYPPPNHFICKFRPLKFLTVRPWPPPIFKGFGLFWHMTGSNLCKLGLPRLAPGLFLRQKAPWGGRGMGGWVRGQTQTLLPAARFFFIHLGILPNPPLVQGTWCCCPPMLRLISSTPPGLFH